MSNDPERDRRWALQREYQLKQLTRPQKQALIRGKLVVKRPR